MKFVDALKFNLFNSSLPIEAPKFSFYSECSLCAYLILILTGVYSC